MRHGFALAWLALLLHIPAFGAESKITAFVGGSLIDGTGSGPRPDAVVLVGGERIVAVGSRQDVRIPEGGRVVEAGGKWIVPGLIDAHVHFFQSGGLYTRPDVIDLRGIRPYAKEIAGIRQRLPTTLARYLASGVTSVVDVGGPFWSFKVRDLARRMSVAPRVAVAGPLISTYVPPELGTDDPPNIKISSPQDAREAVRRVLAYHPDLIKIWFIPIWSESLTSQTASVRAAIEESHAAGIRVAVHATQLEVARAAVQAGADILAHSVDDIRVDNAFVQLLKTRHVVYVTTLVVHEGYQNVLGQKVNLTDIERRVGDPEVIASWGDLDRLPAWKLPFWSYWSFRWPSREIMLWNLKRLQQSGITIAAGTDAGNIGTLHGPALHRELERMVEAGLSPQDILTAATQGGARVLGRASELGTLEPGQLADFLLLAANPLVDITNARRIWRIVKGGVIFSPQEIVNEN